MPGHSGKDPIAHILYLKDAEPDLYRRTHLFLEPINWLGLKLTGRAVASFDSITLHWVADSRDIANVRYDDGLLRTAGIDRAKLPELVPAASVVGTLTPEAAARAGPR